jgi:hypothetical protein
MKTRDFIKYLFLLLLLLQVSHADAQVFAKRKYTKGIFREHFRKPKHPETIENKAIRLRDRKENSTGSGVTDVTDPTANGLSNSGEPEERSIVTVSDTASANSNIQINSKKKPVERKFSTGAKVESLCTRELKKQEKTGTQFAGIKSIQASVQHSTTTSSGTYPGLSIRSSCFLNSCFWQSPGELSLFYLQEFYSNYFPHSLWRSGSARVSCFSSAD